MSLPLTATDPHPLDFGRFGVDGPPEDKERLISALTLGSRHMEIDGTAHQILRHGQFLARANHHLKAIALEPYGPDRAPFAVIADHLAKQGYEPVHELVAPLLCFEPNLPPGEYVAYTAEPLRLPGQPMVYVFQVYKEAGKPAWLSALAVETYLVPDSQDARLLVSARRR